GKDLALADAVDFERLAHVTAGLTGADLAALCRKAAMNALHRVLPHIDLQRGYIPYETLLTLTITMADFDQALEQLPSKAMVHLASSEQVSPVPVSPSEQSRFSLLQRILHLFQEKA